MIELVTCLCLWTVLVLGCHSATKVHLERHSTLHCSCLQQRNEVTAREKTERCSLSARGLFAFFQDWGCACAEPSPLYWVFLVANKHTCGKIIGWGGSVGRGSCRSCLYTLCTSSLQHWKVPATAHSFTAVPSNGNIMQATGSFKIVQEPRF